MELCRIKGASLGAAFDFGKPYLLPDNIEKRDKRMNQSDLARNSSMLQGSLAKRGYMRWWHSFSGTQPESGKVRTFFVEFFIINPRLGANTPIPGQHPYFKKKGMKPSYVMVKAGVFPDTEGNGSRQLHAFYPVSALRATDNPLVMHLEGHPEAHCRAGHCFYSEDKLTGFVEVTREEARHRSYMTDSGFMEWNLEIRKAVACHTGKRCGKFFQVLNILDSYWHGEGIRSFFRGSVTLDGVTYEVLPESSYGYADKHWGRSFNSPWFQFACGKLNSLRAGQELRHSVLAVNVGCPRFLGFRLKERLMLQLTYMGEDFEFNRCKWETKENGKRYIWHIFAQNKKTAVKISGSCTRAEMLHLHYEDPDGRRRKLPLLAGGSGIGTVQIFRKTDGVRELIDTLNLGNALCIYQDIPERPIHMGE